MGSRFRKPGISNFSGGESGLKRSQSVTPPVPPPPTIYFADPWDDNVALNPGQWNNFGGGGNLVKQNGHLEHSGVPGNEFEYAIDPIILPWIRYRANLVGRELNWRAGVKAVLASGLFMQISDLLFAFPTSIVWAMGAWGWQYEGVTSFIWTVAPPAMVAGTFYDFRIRFVAINQVEFYINNVLLQTSNPAIPLTIEPAAFTVGSSGEGMFNDFLFQDIP